MNDSSKFVRLDSRTDITNDLHDAALYEILERGAAILGAIEDCTNTGSLSDWMSAFPDTTKLVHLNIPGTHDTCTWNYTSQVQESLKRYTGPVPEWRVFRCQSSSIFKMLNDGIRFLDLRYAWNPDLETIGFYHAQALLSSTTRMEDVLFGLYHWISLHPSETILVPMNYEPGAGRENNTKLQEKIHAILTSKLAKKHWAQRRGSLETLGENRGKLILIQRFGLPPHLEELPGIHLDPGHWTVNGKNTEIEYAEGNWAYIQDYYKIDPSSTSEPSSCIEDKLEVVKHHLHRAMDPKLHPDQLYISFASASFRIEEPYLTPEVYARGDSTKDTEGINSRLLNLLNENQGKRFGVVLLDFYAVVPDLVEAIVGDPKRITE